jgi:hypothetical protein
MQPFYVEGVEPKVILKKRGQTNKTSIGGIDMNEHWWDICPEISTATSATQKESTLTFEKLQETMDNLLKNKIEIKSSIYIDEEQFFIIDHEKLRKSIPSHEERGKTIVCHPKNEAKIRNFMNQL